MTNVERFIVKCQNENGAKATFPRERGADDLLEELVEVSGWDKTTFKIHRSPFGLEVEVERS